MSGHAKLSPSGSSLWLTCDAGAVLNQVDPMTKRSSDYADEGTCAHSLSELLLQSKSNRVNAYKAQGRKIDGWTVDNMMIGFCLEYVDYVLSIAKEKELGNEAKLPLFYSPNETGTTDAIWHSVKTKTLHVFDLKYGKGIKVFAEKNSQLSIYAASFVIDNPGLKIDKIVLHICMPRLEHFDTWELTRDELMSFSETVVKRVDKIRDLCTDYVLGGVELEYTPSDKGCQWCPRKGKCGAFQRRRFEDIKVDFEDLDEDVKKTKKNLEKKMKDLTLAELEMVTLNGTKIANYLKEVKAEVLERLMSGEEGTYTKPVQSFGNRAWTDEEEVEVILKKYFKKEAYKVKLVSPTQAEALSKGLPGRTQTNYINKIMDLVHKPEGGPCIARLNDKRPSIQPIEDEFDDLDEIEGEDIL